MAPQAIGYLGMGIMGTAMARNLLKSGQFELVVWNRNQDKVGWWTAGSCCASVRGAGKRMRACVHVCVRACVVRVRACVCAK